MSEPLLEIKNLVTGFETESGLLKAVDGVSFTVPKGSCVGTVSYTHLDVYKRQEGNSGIPA